MATHLGILADLGPVGQGASSARVVLAENHDEYLIKGPNLSPKHRHAGTNEFLCAHLAAALGVPTLDSRLLAFEGKTVFARRFLHKDDTWYDGLTEALFASCDNRNRVYALVVFDSFVLNADRHEGNFVVRERRQGATWRRDLLATDHDRCLIPPGQDAVGLANEVNSSVGRYARIGYLNRAITSIDLLAQVLATVESLQDEWLQALAELVPPEWCDAEARHHLASFLIDRRDCLRGHFQQARNLFVNLGAGDL